MLPDHHREVIEVRYLQERLVEDTAQATSRTHGSVMMISQRALREIARIILEFPLLTPSGPHAIIIA